MTATATPLAKTYPLYRMSVEKYNRLIESGVLNSKDRFFLWKGLLVEKMTKKRPHVVAQNEADRVLGQIVPEGWFVEQDQPLELGRHSVPEPDVKVLRGTRRDYLTRNPTPKDVGLVVEVSDSSLPLDSGEMLEAYAAEGVPIYWIVNLPGRCIDVYSQPTGPSYAEHQTYGPDARRARRAGRRRGRPDRRQEVLP